MYLQRVTSQQVSIKEILSYYSMFLHKYVFKIKKNSQVFKVELLRKKIVLQLFNNNKKNLKTAVKKIEMAKNYSTHTQRVLGFNVGLLHTFNV